jgi:HEPN domain-containing protein
MRPQNDTVPDFLFHSAMGFYDVARNCANNIKKDTTITGFQRLAPAAVNFCFTAELFLKGLLLLTNPKQIRGHFLMDLFQKLPEATKVQIEVRYEYHQKDDKEKNDLGAYKMSVSKNKSEREFDKPDNITLEHLLKSHNKGFENWRYLHEINDNGYVYDIDFKSLNCFIKALIDTINSFPKYQRLFLKNYQ